LRREVARVLDEVLARGEHVYAVRSDLDANSTNVAVLGCSRRRVDGSARLTTHPGGSTYNNNLAAPSGHQAVVMVSLTVTLGGQVAC
jgi:hypothetical protein